MGIGIMSPYFPYFPLFPYSQLHDPATNIAAGTAFVKLKIGYAHGDVEKGLDMYGTGSGYGKDKIGCAAGN
jgi:soluble lytic murein transglycosylase-like protein